MVAGYHTHEIVLKGDGNADIYDPEGRTAIEDMQITMTFSSGSQPGWLTWNAADMKFTATLTDNTTPVDVTSGDTTEIVNVYISDKESPYSLNIKITMTLTKNTVPSFSIPNSMVSTMGAAESFDLPAINVGSGAIVDGQGDLLSYEFDSYTPGSVTANIFSINGSRVEVQGGTVEGDAQEYSVKVKLTDGHDSSEATFTWKIGNNIRPSISPTYPNSQSADLTPTTFVAYHSLTYQHPQFLGFAEPTDTSNSQTLDSANSPTWISYDSATRTFTLSDDPTINNNSIVGDHKAILLLDDGFYPQVQVEVWFKCTINSTPTLPVMITQQTFAYHIDIYNIVGFLDVDNDPITVEAAITPTNSFMTFNWDQTNNFGALEISGAQTNADVQEYTVTLTATDGFPNDNQNLHPSISGSFTWRIVTNKDPFIPTLSNQNQYAYTSLEYDIQGLDNVDLEGDTPAEISVKVDGTDIADQSLISWDSANTKFVLGSPQNSNVGTYTVAITTSDSKGEDTSQSFDWEILNNPQSVLPLVNDESILENYPMTITYGALYDLVDDVATTTVKAFINEQEVSGTVGLTTGFPWIHHDAAAHQIIITPQGQQYDGIYNMKLTADDGNGLTPSEETFTLTVLDNTAPSISGLADQSNWAHQQGNTVNINVFDNAEDNSNFQVTTEFDGVVFPAFILSSISDVRNGYKTVEFKLNPDALPTNAQADEGNESSKTYTLSVKASDGFNSEVVQEMSWEIKYNFGPIIGMIESDPISKFAYRGYSQDLPQISDNEGDSISITSVSLKDSNGESVTPSWFIYDEGNRKVLIDQHNPPSNSDVGNYSVELVASDGVTSSTYTFAIQIKTNHPPVIPPVAHQTMVAYASWEYTLPLITDSEDDPITTTVTLDGSTQFPNWITFNSPTFTIQEQTVDNSQIGTHTFLITSTDGNNITTKSFTLTIQSNLAPTIGDVNSVTTDIFKWKTLKVNGIADPEDDPINYSLFWGKIGNNDQELALDGNPTTEGLPNWLLFSNTNTSFSIDPASLPTPVDLGLYRIKLVVTSSPHPDVGEAIFTWEIKETEDKQGQQERQGVTSALGLGMLSSGIISACIMANPTASYYMVYGLQNVGTIQFLNLKTTIITENFAKQSQIFNLQWEFIDEWLESMDPAFSSRQLSQDRFLQASVFTAQTQQLNYKLNQFISITFSILIFWAIYALFYFPIKGLAYVFTESFKTSYSAKLFRKAARGYAFNTTFKFMSIFSTITWIAIFLNIQSQSPYDSAAKVFSIILAFLAFLAYVLQFIAGLWVITRDQNKLAMKSFRRTWGEFYNDYKPSFKYRLTPIFFYVRNFAVACVITSLYNYSQTKIALLIILNCSYMIWVLVMRPYKNGILNAIGISNELFISFLSFYYIGFLNYFPSSVSYGEALIILVYIFMMLQTFLVLVYFIYKVVKYFQGENNKIRSAQVTSEEKLASRVTPEKQSTSAFQPQIEEEQNLTQDDLPQEVVQDDKQMEAQHTFKQDSDIPSVIPQKASLTGPLPEIQKKMTESEKDSIKLMKLKEDQEKLREKALKDMEERKKRIKQHEQAIAKNASQNSRASNQQELDPTQKVGLKKFMGDFWKIKVMKNAGIKSNVLADQSSARGVFDEDDDLNYRDQLTPPPTQPRIPDSGLENEDEQYMD